MPIEFDDFVLQQASGWHGVKEPALRRGLRRIYGRGAATVVHTEFSERWFDPVIRQEARKAGYPHVIHLKTPFGGYTDSVIVLSEEWDHVTSRYRSVLPPNHKPPTQGGYAARGVTRATGNWRGSRISVCTTHGLTQFGNAERRAKSLHLFDVLGTVMDNNAKGERLAFGTADTNVSHKDRYYAQAAKVWREHGMISCWHDLGRFLPTAPGKGVRTLDWIWRLDRDGRVGEADNVILRRAEGFDHPQVLSTYPIRKAS